MSEPNTDGLPSTPQAVYEVIYDGADCELEMKDGTKKRVRVRKVSQKNLPQLADAMRLSMEQGEIPEIMVYLSWTAEQVEQLADESQDAVMQEGRRLNFTRFKNFLARRVQFVNLMGDVPANVIELAQKLSTTSLASTSS